MVLKFLLSWERASLPVKIQKALLFRAQAMKFRQTSLAIASCTAPNPAVALKATN